MDNFITLFSNESKDLRIIKFVSYFFVGLLGLTINFQKNFFYTSRFSYYPNSTLAYYLELLY